MRIDKKFGKKDKKLLVKKRDSGLPLRKKTCRFCAEKNRVIDYKDTRLLESLIRERGKILPSRVSGNCAKHQRKVRDAINQARFVSLIPYVR